MITYGILFMNLNCMETGGTILHVLIAYSSRNFISADIWMGKGKLILICQCGGEFVKNDDGSLKYAGGEAQAVNVNFETLFDDLKLKVAEVCNLEYKSVSIKYFLPGNTRTLISLANDKDLKRMLDFHGNSVTADVFVMGREGFNRDALNIDTNRYLSLVQIVSKETAILVHFLFMFSFIVLAII